MPDSNPQQNNPKTLNDLSITISLEEYFSLSYYRHLSNTVVVSEERFNKLACQEGFNDLVHFDSYVSEATKQTLYRLQRKENLVKSSLEKDKEREKEQAQLFIAKQKHVIIEQWKKDSLYKLMKTGKATKEVAMEFIMRAMNPKNERDKTIADKLAYPYREDISNEEDSKEKNDGVKISETSATYNKTT